MLPKLHTSARLHRQSIASNFDIQFFSKLQILHNLPYRLRNCHRLCCFTSTITSNCLQVEYYDWVITPWNWSSAAAPHISPTYNANWSHFQMASSLRRNRKGESSLHPFGSNLYWKSTGNFQPFEGGEFSTLIFILRFIFFVSFFFQFIFSFHFFIFFVSFFYSSFIKI